MNNCLIIDDNEVIRQVAAATVRELGFQEVMAENGKVALSVLEKTDITVILLDYHMPVMNGLEFLREMHKNPEWQGVKVFLHTNTLSAGAQEIHDIMALEGVDGFLHKPSTITLMREAFESVGLSCGSQNKGELG